jgi:hypothetical protein
MRWTRAAGVLLVAGVTLLAAPVLEAYLKLGFRVGDRTVTLRWTRFPVRYFVSDRGVPEVTAMQFRDAVNRAVQSWQAVPASAITFDFAGFTSADPFRADDMSVLGFQHRPELERVLGATTFLINAQTGEIIEADIFFNSTFPWSVAPAGQPGRYDVESIALHEVGHLLGLGHSAIGETELVPGGRRVIASEAVMFPIAFSPGNIDDRTLKADDRAGASDIYPAGDFRSRTGSISGRVTRQGRGVFGAHVVAFNPRTGELIGNFSLDDDGRFVIAGLQPGPHVVRAEPVDDAEVESFFDVTTPVELDFRVTFYDRLVVVPRGGTAPAIEIQVAPR